MNVLNIKIYEYLQEIERTEFDLSFKDNVGDYTTNENLSLLKMNYPNKS